MNYDPVKSSILDAVAYDDRSSTLRVRFKNGTQYEYSGLPATVYRGLLTAKSSGIYFDANVKEAGYWFRRVG
jgi:KTSC domain